METPIFIPYTKDSTLRKRLQEADDRLGVETNSPSVKFVERCGGSTLINILTRSNPWISEWNCGRKECLPCKGRMMLACEEAERPEPKPGDPALPRPSREQVRASPKCTSEGFGYKIECWPCRLVGKTFAYIGESSRSPYQRGREHWQEVDMRKPNHPLTIHSEEEHEGREIEILMRVIKQTETATERQVWESVMIDSLARKDPKGCLNLKNEWGHSKNPSLETKTWREESEEDRELGTETGRTREI